MKEKRTVKKSVNKNIEINLDEIHTVEKYISQILVEDNLNRLNEVQNNNIVKTEPKVNSLFKLINKDGNLEFISLDKNALRPYSQLITEKEFFEIVGATKRGLSKKSGRYQEKLYGHYLEAVKEQDDGYIYDVLNKAMIFQNNLNYVKSLMKNEKFMVEWRKDFGKELPTDIFRTSGELRLINIVESRV